MIEDNDSKGSNEWSSSEKKRLKNKAKKLRKNDATFLKETILNSSYVI